MAQGVTETQDITQEELDEIERLDREATPGPWATRPAYRDGEDVEDVISKADGNCNVADSCSLSDATLIALARTLLPRLARAYRALRDQKAIDEAELRELRAYTESQLAEVYANGRREAIEEAAKYLRTFDSTAVKSAAWLMEKHETEISK